MANLFTLQDHLEVIKTGTLDQKKQKLTPESIADVRDFIASERANREKGTHYSLEGQFHEWEDLIKKFEGDKLVISATTATGTSSVRDTVPPVQMQEKRDVVDPVKMKSIKTALEKEANTPLTIQTLSSALDKLTEETDPNSRAVIVSYLWSKLAHAGYNISLGQGNQLIIGSTPNLQKSATEVAATLSAYMRKGILTPSDIQRAMIVGPASFGRYADTQKVDIRNASTEGYAQFLLSSGGIDLSKGRTLDQQIRLIQNSKIVPEEKAFLVSYISGGFANYNLSPEMERQMGINRAGAEIKASPVYKKTEKTVDTISAGGLEKEKQAMKQGGKAEELTLDTFMNNPTMAITKYPWASLTLLIGGIWKFGFMKTIGGLLFGMIGIKALNEIGTETGLGKQIKDGLQKGVKAAGEAAEGAIDGGKAAVASGTAAVAEATKPAEKKEVSAHTPSQELAEKEVMKESSRFNAMIQSHIKANPNQSAPLEDYVKLLHSPELQSQKLDSILYSQNAKASIFQNEKNWELTMRIPGNMDPVILKKIFRQYLTGSFMLETPTEGSQEGDKERIAFEKKHSLSANDKNKTIKDILPNIYK